MDINEKSKVRVKGQTQVKTNFPDRYLGQVQWNEKLELWLRTTSAKKTSLLTPTTSTSFSSKNLGY